MHLSLLPAALLFGAVIGQPAQDETPTAQAAQGPAPETDPTLVGDDLGPPLYVGDVLITENQIKRYLIYGICRASLEYRRVNAVIEDGIQRRIAGYEDELATWEAIKASGADPGPEPIKYTREYFTIPQEKFEKHRQYKYEQFMSKFPTLDLTTEMRRAYRTGEWYDRELYQEMLFDLVYVDDDPEKWPDVTFEAMRQEAGEVLIDDFRESYERRLAYYENSLAEWQAKKDAGEDAGPEPEMGLEDPMYRSILRQIVRDTIYGVCETKTALDGLSEDLICTMDFDFDGEIELSLTVEELWNDIKPTITRHDVIIARRFLALMEATRQRLALEGYLLDEEEAAKYMDEVEAGFGTNFVGIGMIALGTHGFPSIESYGEYMPLLEGYRLSVLDKTASPPEGGLAPALRQHLNIANQVMGLAKVDAEVLLVSAFDMENFQWIPEGWPQAREKAEWLAAEIRKNGVEFADYRKRRLQAAAEGRELPEDEGVMEPHAFWSRLIDEHSDFWDPPPPTFGNPGSDKGYRKLGRFGERTRNDMRGLLFESPFSHIVYGGMLTDTIFFKTAIGNVVGPIRGPLGWYLAKVVKRTPAQRPLNINDERHLKLLTDDWVTYSFVPYAHEALEMVGTTGLRTKLSPRYDGDEQTMGDRGDFEAPSEEPTEKQEAKKEQ